DGVSRLCGRAPKLLSYCDPRADASLFITFSPSSSPSSNSATANRQQSPSKITSRGADILKLQVIPHRYQYLTKHVLDSFQVSNHALAKCRDANRMRKYLCRCERSFWPGVRHVGLDT